jgi:molecular chaperone GrpE
VSDANTPKPDTNPLDELEQMSQDADFEAGTEPSENPDQQTDEHDPVIDHYARVEELEKQLTETKARANADMYNFQKRVERETASARKFANERLARDLLEIVDNLERAITAAEAADSKDSDALLDGVRITYKAMLSTLERHKIEVIDPVGQDFNADFHEAVGVDPEAEAGKVAQVLQKGYRLEERLLRPAMVRVGQ